MAFPSQQEAQKAILKLIHDEELKLDKARRILAHQLGLTYNKDYRHFTIKILSQKDLYFVEIINKAKRYFIEQTKKPLTTLNSAFDYAFELIDDYHKTTD